MHDDNHCDCHSSISMNLSGLGLFQLKLLPVHLKPYGIRNFLHLYNKIAYLEQNQHSKLTDEELLLAYKSSNSNEWLGYLLQRYTMLLLGVAMKYLKDKEQAHDAVQQVFLKVLTYAHTAEVNNFKGWLYILTRNYCLQILRDKNFKIGDDVLATLPMTEPEDKEEMLLHEYTLEQLKTALEELNDEQKKCLVLFYLEQKSYQDIMDKTGFSYVQVKSYIQNGKRNLKTILLQKLREKTR